MTSLVDRWLNDKDPVGADYSIRVELPRKCGIVEVSAEEAERQMREAYYESDAGKAELRRKNQAIKMIA